MSKKQQSGGPGPNAEERARRDALARAKQQAKRKAKKGQVKVQEEARKVTFHELYPKAPQDALPRLDIMKKIAYAQKVRPLDMGSAIEGLDY